jgi:hypothetical protein
VTDNSKTVQAEALLAKIKVAFKAVNEAQTELVSRSTVVGKLLLEAKNCTQRSRTSKRSLNALTVFICRELTTCCDWPAAGRPTRS